MLHSLPEHIKIDVEIGVDETVAHTDDVRPRDRRQLFSSILGYLIGGFTNDLYGFDQRENKHFIFIEIVSRSTVGEG